MMDNRDQIRDYVRSWSFAARAFPRVSNKIIDATIMHWPIDTSVNMAANDKSYGNIGRRAGVSPMVWFWLIEIVAKLIIRWWANRRDSSKTLAAAKSEIERLLK